MKILINSRDNYLYSLEINDKYEKNWVGLKTIASLPFNDKLKRSVKVVKKSRII